MPRRKRRFYRLFTYGHDYQPGWRWLRANELLSELAPTHGRCERYCSRQVEGAAVTRLYRYLRTMRMGYLHERRQAKIMQQYIDIIEAIRINNEGGVNRLELRLRLFVGQSADTIAKIMGVDAEVVVAYSVYFFDVREERHRNVFLFRQQNPDRTSTDTYEDIKNDRLEGFLYVFVSRFSCDAIPSALDSFAHRGEIQDLSTKVGRRREQIELHYLGFLGRNVSSLADSATNYRVAKLIQTSNLGLTSFAKPTFLEHWQAVVNEMPEVRTTEVVDVDYVAPQERPKPTAAATCSPAVWKVSHVLARYPRTSLARVSLANQKVMVN